MLTLLGAGPGAIGGTAVTVTPSTLGLTVSAVAPTIAAGATISVSAQSVAASLNAPIITTTGETLVTPSVQSVTASLVAPTIIAGQVVTPSALGVTANLIAPTVDEGVTRVNVGAQSVTASLIAPTVTGGQLADFKRHRIGFPFPATPANEIEYYDPLLNETGDFCGWAIQAPEACTITKVGFRYRDNINTPPEYKIGIQLLNSSGLPDGSYVASALFTPPADNTWDNTVQWITLDAGYAVTRGQFFSIVIEATSVSGSNYSGFSTGVQNIFGVRYAFPHALEKNTGGSWSRTNVFPLWGYQSATKTYGTLFQTFVQTQFNANSTPDEYGMKFTLDAGYGTSFKVVGVRAIVTTPAAGSSVKLALYNGTTELQAITFDSDICNGATQPARMLEMYFDEATLETLSFGTTYRVAFASQDNSTAMALACITVPTSTDFTAFAGGTDFALSTRTDAGAWTDTATSRPFIELLIEDWTE